MDKLGINVTRNAYLLYLFHASDTAQRETIYLHEMKTVSVSQSISCSLMTWAHREQWYQLAWYYAVIIKTNPFGDFFLIKSSVFWCYDDFANLLFELFESRSNLAVVTPVKYERDIQYINSDSVILEEIK